VAGLPEKRDWQGETENAAKTALLLSEAYEGARTEAERQTAQAVAKYCAHHVGDRVAGDKRFTTTETASVCNASYALILPTPRKIGQSLNI